MKVWDEAAQSWVDDGTTDTHTTDVPITGNDTTGATYTTGPDGTQHWFDSSGTEVYTIAPDGTRTANGTTLETPTPDLVTRINTALGTNFTGSQVVGMGAATIAALGSMLQKTPDPVAQAKAIHDQAYGFAHTPISIKNADGTTRTFDPYGPISGIPMAREQIALTTNPTGRDFSTNAASNPSGTVPGMVPPKTAASGGYIHNYADGGSVDTSAYVPKFASGGLTAADLTQMGQTGDYSAMMDYLQSQGMDANQAAQWYNNLMGTSLTGDQVDRNLYSTGLAPLVGEQARLNTWGASNNPTHFNANTEYQSVPAATERISGDQEATFQNMMKAGDTAGAYKYARSLGYSDADIALYDSQIYGQDPSNVQKWIQGYNQSNNPAIPPNPNVSPAPPSPAGGSSAVNTLPAVAPMGYQQSLIPFKGDWLHYGEGPEHLFYNSVNPLYAGQNTGSIWDPSVVGRTTHSNENLDYVPPTTVNPSTLPTVSSAGTNAFTSNIAHGQTAPGANAWWNYNNPNNTVPNASTTGNVTTQYNSDGTPVAAGATPYATGGRAQTSGLGALSPRMQGHIQGPGTGQSDSIPAALSNGEYVLDSEVVAALGDGSTEAGAKALDGMRHAIRKHKRSAPITSIPPKAKAPMAYMKGGKL